MLDFSLTTISPYIQLQGRHFGAPVYCTEYERYTRKSCSGVLGEPKFLRQMTFENLLGKSAQKDTLEGHFWRLDVVLLFLYSTSNVISPQEFLCP